MPEPTKPTSSVEQLSLTDKLAALFNQYRICKPLYKAVTAAHSETVDSHAFPLPHSSLNVYNRTTGYASPEHSALLLKEHAAYLTRKIKDAPPEHFKEEQLDLQYAIAKHCAAEPNIYSKMQNLHSQLADSSKTELVNTYQKKPSCPNCLVHVDNHFPKKKCS